jgi:hypothetical protein
MDWLFDSLFGNLKEGLIDAVMDRFENMFTSVNNQIGGIADQVGQTPQGWNANIFNMIQSLSETVILPIAGIILTFVACYELIQLVIGQNNMHQFEPVAIYKWFFKTAIAVFILTNTFTIVMAVFDLAQFVVNNSAGLITGNLEVGVGDTLDDFRVQLEGMGFFELLWLWLESFIVSLSLQILNVVIFVIIFGRMLEIYLTVSIAPIPFATMTNRDWGQIGNNYIKALLALGFQGFFIMVCVAIYAALVQAIPAADNAHIAIWTVLGYTILLSFCLFKTGSLSKALWGSH